MPATPRIRARLLLRSGRTHPGLFAPLLIAQAAEIEVLPIDEFLTNPTKLANGLTALHRSLDIDAVTVAGPDTLGEPDRIEAAVEATARLAVTAPGDPVLVAVLPGPASVAGTDSMADDPEAALETASETILAALKRFGEAGTSLVVLFEDVVPPEPAVDAWRSAVIPLVNVSRFHQALPVMVFSEAIDDRVGADCVAATPPALGTCLPAGVGVAGPPNRIMGTALPLGPKEWAVPAGGFPLTVTAGVVPARYSFAEVHEACRRLTTG